MGDFKSWYQQTFAQPNSLKISPEYLTWIRYLNTYIFLIRPIHSMLKLFAYILEKISTCCTHNNPKLASGCLKLKTYLSPLSSATVSPSLNQFPPYTDNLALTGIIMLFFIGSVTVDLHPTPLWGYKGNQVTGKAGRLRESGCTLSKAKSWSKRNAL